jgi:hypothetical protein
MNEDLSELNLVELYDRLIMPAAPEPVSMWPETAGWLWLAAALLVVAGVGWWRWARWREATAYRRAALDALQEVGDDPAAIADVLKRAALAGFPRDDVASLHGADWLAFLDRVGRGNGFAGSEAGKVLATAPYQPQPPHKDLQAMAARWIKTHHNDGHAT